MINMKNSEIIETLIIKYNNINYNKSLKDDSLVIDTDLQSKENLEKLDKEGIDLIIVGDNPGKSERKKGKYFFEQGSAGKHAHTFIEFAKYLRFSDKRNFNFLLLNKTPFYSSRTENLGIENKIVKSLDFTIEALNNFSLNNNDLIVLIVGCSKNDLNKLFYPKLKKSTHENLVPKLRFAKHFSNGHFMEQFVNHLHLEMERLMD